jgi:hypothetical protein
MMSMKKRVSAALTVVALLGLSACGGGGGTPSAVPAGPAASKHALATFTIKIPNAVSAQGAARRPNYISPNTQSASIQLVSVNGTASKQAATVVALTPGSPNCSSSTGTLVCTASVPAPAGSDVFSLTLFSAANAGGSQLSSGTVTATIVAGTTNTVALTLNGIVSAVTLSATTATITGGAAATIPLTVTATDASGATIVGPGNYSPAITLTDSDTSGHTKLSSATVAAPGGSAITLTYDGSAALDGATITIGATATGVAAGSVKPASILVSTATTLTESGATAFAVLSDPAGNIVAELPTSSGVSTVPLATAGSAPLWRKAASVRSVKSAAVTATPPPALPITPAPDECAPDRVDSQLDCMSFGSGIISVVSYNPANVLAGLTLVGQIQTDATSYVPFSGNESGLCIVCGIAYDPTDHAVIISTANGYELYSPSAATATPTTVTAPVTTVPAPISENFGYDANTDQIFSPYYSSGGFVAPGANLDIINITGGVGTWYDLATADIPTGLSAPDAGAVDTKTGIAISPEENSFPVYLQSLPPPGSSDFVPNPTPTALGPGGTLNETVASVTPSTAASYNETYSGEGCDLSYVAADSVEDLAFFGDEFCPSTDVVAVGQLPASATTTAAFSNYVITELPAIPSVGGFVSPLDPHAALTVNLPGVCSDCGVLFNLDKSYIAIVDLNKLLALAPTASPNGYAVPSTTDLLADGVVEYIPTGLSSPPSAALRARAAYRRAHRRT